MVCRHAFLASLLLASGCGVDFVGSTPGVGGSGASSSSTVGGAGGLAEVGGMGGAATGGAPTSSVGGGGLGGGGLGGEGTGGGLPRDVAGCSDGTREGFADVQQWPDIAACDGGWDVPGLKPATGVQCNRVSGDDSINPDGVGCAADDLCAQGWDICGSRFEVDASSPDGCVDVTTVPSRFYATRQSGDGANQCADRGTDDLAGCGTLGGAAPSSCAPLDRFSFNACSGLTTSWDCGLNSTVEASVVVKPTVADGGVLCCRQSADD